MSVGEMGTAEFAGAIAVAAFWLALCVGLALNANVRDLKRRLDKLEGRR